MEKQSYVDSRLISIASRGNHDGSASVVATLYLGQNIEFLSLSFPMKNLASANHFVSNADQDAFVRAAAKLHEESEFISHIENGLQNARIPKRRYTHQR